MIRFTARTSLSVLCVAALGALAAPSFAVGTRRFVLDKEADFKGGDLTGVAVDSAGRVRAGLSLGNVPLAQATSVWSALPLGDGSVLLGTGSEGKLLKVQGGAVSVLAETKTLAVTSLAQGFGGSVLLGTLPGGKVMKWDGGKLSDLAALPGADHVFGIAYDKKTNSLFAATGPQGKLFRVDANGTSQVYFDAEEPHLVSVAVDANGTVYAGASDKAKLYKVTGPGRASVLYDFGRTEVRAIAVDGNGDVFAIANELKPSGVLAQRPAGGSDISPAGPLANQAKTKGKGTLYRFSKDGRPERLYDNDDEHFTSLSLGDDGRPYVGTGIEGHVYSVDQSLQVALVADVDERQVGALVMQGASRLIASSDPAALHPVRGVGGPDAVWTSKTLDAGLRARFGRMTWESTGPVEVSTRTGNTKDPDETWSAWSKDSTAATLVDSPPGRFLQVRARFAKDPKANLSAFEVAFVTDNLRATVSEVTSGAKRDASTDAIRSSGGPITKKPEPKLSLNWKVENPDKDELRYRLQYRFVGANTWYDLTRSNEIVTKESYEWDTSNLPEGRYRIRVVATDELSNPPDRVTRAEAESGVLLVDNTPPRIENLKAAGRRVQGQVSDGVGPIQRIDVALAGSDDWIPFFPADGIFDEQREEFDMDVTVHSATGPAIVAVRVFDDANNYVIQNVALK
jgi:hypothetical protein